MRQRRRGTPLWVYLTALVLVPLMGVVVLTAAIAATRRGEATSAARAEDAVHTLAELDAARSGVESEVVPTLCLIVIDDPAMAAELGLPAMLLAAQRQLALDSQRGARQRADEALTRAGTDPVAVDAVTAARSALQDLRTRADAGDLALEEVYLGYLSVSNQLMTAQRSTASVASADGVPVATARAVQDVLVAAELAQTASRQMPLYLAASFAGDDSALGARLAWQTGWLAYTDAQARMTSLSQASLRTAWDVVHHSTAVVRVDEALAPPADQDAPLAVSIPELVPLLFRSLDRDTSYTALVDTAAEHAETLTAADRQEADQRLHLTLLLGGVLLIASTLGALALGRSVSRSLGVLAGQADQVSRGELVQVEAGGPREVRTVSAALDSAVASLRRIQDQADAVARGDLDDALLEQPLPGPLGEVVHASVQQIVTAVRQREELQTELAHQAAHDPLTELPNRAQALTLTTSALYRGQRSGEMTGLLFVDLDGFKAVNDSHGHACGDDVLREVATRLRAVVRAGDVVCRLGGDEFVVLVEPVETESDLLELADRLIAVVSEPIAAAGHLVTVGASVGVAVSRDAITDADVLFAEADAATYRAKAHGRGRAEIFDEALRAQLAARAELEAAITFGLDNGEMELQYQPVVDMSASVTGFEALIRWNRPGHGRVSPDDFIPVAEASRLICDLDRWVLREATRQLAAWRRDWDETAGAPEPTVAVNISGRHLADRQVVQDVAEALAASGLPARLLVLEVTETVLVDDPVAIENLAALRELGAAVAIDDFGTGYTSIGQLLHLPVDTLKIDRSFIGSGDAGHEELVALMIRTAHTFGLTVVAEGVERQAQLDRLRADACDKVQGYLLHRPLSAADAGALLPRGVPTAG